MSRVQLALRVADLEGSIAFYSKLFGAEPAKRRPGYANFAVNDPPLKLVLIEGGHEEPTIMDHLGVEVEDTAQVTEAAVRLDAAGLATVEEKDKACCYAIQDKVWVHGPGGEPWEVYVVKGDADDLAKASGSACCVASGEASEQQATQVANQPGTKPLNQETAQPAAPHTAQVTAQPGTQPAATGAGCC